MNQHGPESYPSSSSVIFSTEQLREKHQMMGSTASEDGVLKLVLPGRYVEIHKQPVAASEILKKYPRHSVTRPDVFQYPWVVVKPESVLKLGKVFFVVPNHFLYNLMKSHRKIDQHFLHKTQSPEKPDNEKVQNQDAPLKLQVGATLKHRNSRRKSDKSPPSISCIWIPYSLHHDRDLRIRKQNKVVSWPETMLKNKISHLRLEEKPVEDSRIANRSSNHEEDHNIDTNIIGEFHKRKYDNLEFRHRQEVTMLKSCLRKPDSVRRSVQFKVSFVLPAKDEKHQRRVKVSGEEFAGNNSCRFADFLVHSTSLVPP